MKLERTERAFKSLRALFTSTTTINANSSKSFELVNSEIENLISKDLIGYFFSLIGNVGVNYELQVSIVNCSVINSYLFYGIIASKYDGDGKTSLDISNLQIIEYNN